MSGDFRIRRNVNVTTTTHNRGLSESQARQKRAQGEGNDVRIQTTRTYRDILQYNLLTFINMVLFIIGVAMISLGLYRDALVTVGVAFLSVIINVAQEFRAKYQLDKIVLLTRPKVTVLRDDEEREIDPSQVVRGDWLVARPGDQIVVDGVIVGTGRMEVDESLLTGESDLIAKRDGDDVLSGSYVVNGSAIYEARKVGTESYINKLSAEAKTFTTTVTPLQRDINFVLRTLVLTATIYGLLFAGSFLYAPTSTRTIVEIAAVITGLVPIGLIVMTATSYALGAVRMLGSGALVQQANAVESMSHINVLCMDKTGTLTANQITLQDIHILDDTQDINHLIGDFAHSVSTHNRTSQALAEACPGQVRWVVDEVPFSSARKWSAIVVDADDMRGTFVLGAPEILNVRGIDPVQVESWLDEGLRVLLFAHTPERVTFGETPKLPAGLSPLCVLTFNDELRPEARETITNFREAGIQLKIISGDNPQTVAALARQAGFGDAEAVSGLELAKMSDAVLQQTALEADIFGRITPEQKERLVKALKDAGLYVAMTGDGVNDVLSLKKAHIGIAMQSGSAATRGVADIVLMNDSFAALPAAFVEGQRILQGMADILKLFLARVFSAALLIIAMSVIGDSRFFPIRPIHDGLFTLLTVGVPTFMLAVWARPGTARTDIIPSTLKFVVPAALSIALTVLAVYLFLLNQWFLPEQTVQAQQQGIDMARTGVIVTLILCGLVLVVFVEPPTQWWVGGDRYSGDWRPTLLAIGMGLILVLILLVEPLREFFELEVLPLWNYGVIGCVVLIWLLCLRAIWRYDVFNRFFQIGG